MIRVDAGGQMVQVAVPLGDQYQKMMMTDWKFQIQVADQAAAGGARQTNSQTQDTSIKLGGGSSRGGAGGGRKLVWSACHGDIHLKKGGAVANKAKRGFGSRGVCADMTMASGQHYAEFAIETWTGPMFIGVIPANAPSKESGMKDGWHTRPNAHMCNSGDRRHYRGGTKSKTKARDWAGSARYKEGDVIGLMLDIGCGSLTVYKNGAQLGDMVPGAEKDLGTGPFLWALDLGGQGSAVRITVRAPHQAPAPVGRPGAGIHVSQSQSQSSSGGGGHSSSQNVQNVQFNFG